MEQVQMCFIYKPMDQDTAKSTEWVHSEDWRSDCTDMQVDEHLIGFMYLKVVLVVVVVIIIIT